MKEDFLEQFGLKLQANTYKSWGRVSWPELNLSKEYFCSLFAKFKAD